MKTRYAERKLWLLLGALVLVALVLLSGRIPHTRGAVLVPGSTPTPTSGFTIVKQTIPSGSPKAFSFNRTGDQLPTPPPSSFVLMDTQSFTYTQAYNVVTESVTPGWALVNITCTGAINSPVHITGASGGTAAFEPGDDTVTIDLADLHVTCTFTNSQGITPTPTFTPTPTRTTCATSPADLVAWYPLNEQNGDTVVDDIAGFNNQGIPTAGALGSPGAPSAAAGQVGGALDFNANFQSSGPHVEVANQSEIDFGTGDYSVDAWVKIPATSSAYAFPVLDKLDYSSQTSGTGYALSVLTYGGPGGLVRLFMGTGGPIAQYLSAPSPSVIPYDTWSHVAVTVSRSAGTVTLYINGGAVPLSSPPPMPAGSMSNTLPLFIGEIREPGKFQAETFVDELQLFKRALSAQDIQSIFNAGGAGKCTPTPAVTFTPTPTRTTCATPPSDMVAWYPLNEQNGATVVDDIAGFNNQGIPTAGALGSPGAPSAAAGEVGGALDFNANFQSSGPHLEVANQSEIDLGAGDFSIDAWVKAPDTLSSQVYAYPILDKLAYSSGTTGTGYSLSLLSYGASGWRVRLFMGDGGPVAEYLSAVNFPWIAYNTWGHVAVTVSRSAGTVTLYINGNSVFLTPGFPSMPAGSLSNTLPLLIGEIREPGKVQVDIFVDELQLFKRALSPQDIQSIYNAGSAGKCTPTPTPTRAATATPQQRSCLVAEGLNISTGTNGTISGSSLDTIWTITSDPSGGGPLPAYGVAGPTTWAVPPALKNPHWINPSSSGSAGTSPAGDYTYQTQFDVPANVATLALISSFAADNTIVYSLIDPNGAPIYYDAPSTDVFGSLIRITVTVGQNPNPKPGKWTLRAVVHNRNSSSGSATATGLLVVGNVTCVAKPPTPTATPTRTDIRTPTVTSTPRKECGDVNDDGRVDSIDDLLVLQYIADLLHDLRNLPSADVNGDGRVNALDALLILQHIAGFDVPFRC